MERTSRLQPWHPSVSHDVIRTGRCLFIPPNHHSLEDRTTHLTARQKHIHLPSMVHENFKHALARTYGPIKAQNPTEGRRKWRLRALYASWPTIGSVSSDIVSDTSFETDSDPLDEFLEDDELGILIRADFSDEGAWNTFVQRLQESQKDLVSELSAGREADASMEIQDAPSTNAAPTAGPSTSASEGEDSDSDSATAPDVIAILDPSDPTDRAKFTNISNLAALRLFNDVDIRPSPGPPAGSKRVSPQNPLIDQGGWQEIYTGKNLWIYDKRSNTDECARLVSPEGDFYGTATGDSWRARAPHIPELQFSMIYQGMKIDFNGLDKYDWTERARNLAECGVL